MKNDIWGFGYERNEKGILKRKENSGDLLIGIEVEIGEFTRIDAGSYRCTMIGNGTKIDSNVKIAHNSIIGRHCLIVAGAVIGGSAEIGDFSYIGMGALILNHKKLGKHCLVAAGAVVTKDWPDNVCLKGNPAKPFIPNMDDGDLFQMTGITKKDLNQDIYNKP